MASLDKEIEVLMLRGEKGYSSYQEAVANGLFVGTLEEWIETFATPDDYITRYEYKKVTQDEYDALAEAGQLQANCYYIITDDDTWEILQDYFSRVETLETSMSTAEDDIDALQEDVSGINTNIETIQGDITDIQGDITGLNTDVDNLEASRLYSRTLINASTDTGYNAIGVNSYNWTVEAPKTSSSYSEKLYILKGTVRYNNIVYEVPTFIIDAVNQSASGSKGTTQDVIITGLGLVKITVGYSSTSLSIRAFLYNVTNFSTSTINNFEFKVESFKAIANWK